MNNQGTQWFIRSMKNIWKPEITLGHVVQIIGMAITVVVIYGNTREERMRTEMRIEATERAVVLANSKLSAHDDAIRTMALTQERIVTLLEERTNKRVAP